MKENLFQKALRQGSKLTFLLWSQLATKWKNLVARLSILVAKLLIHDLHRKVIILNVTLYARKLHTKNSKKNSTRKPPNITAMRCPLTEFFINYRYLEPSQFRKRPSITWLNQRFRYSKLSMDLNFLLTSYQLILSYNDKNSNTKDFLLLILRYRTKLDSPAGDQF